MAFVCVGGSSFAPLSTRHRAHVCHTRAHVRVRMQAEGGGSGGEENKVVPPGQPARPMPKVTNESASRRKLVRNVSDSGSYAQASAGDMVGAPKVGEGMGPKRGVKEKKVTKAAAIQKSQGFADAWAEQNQGRPDVWLAIGLVFLLTPLLILGWGVYTGIIPLGAAFE